MTGNSCPGWCRFAIRPGSTPGDQQITAGFGVIDTWKLLDNLRRSLLPPSLLLLLVAGWLILPGAAWVWTAVALLALAIPTLIGGLTPIVTGRAVTRVRQSVRSLKDGGLRWLLAVVFLPFEAVQMLGADRHHPGASADHSPAHARVDDRREGRPARG